MINDLQYEKLVRRLKTRFMDARCGIFMNQTSFFWKKRKYMVNLIGQIVRLEKIFIPEHGLFAELQDQAPVAKVDHYDFLGTEAEIYSLYPGDLTRLEETFKEMKGLDLLIIDIQETGARYFTYITLIGWIMNAAKGDDFTILVIDRPNPAGRMVEGTLLPENYASMIGLAGLPHRYGLTIGELALLLKDRFGGHFEVEVIKMDDNYEVMHFSCPSPNIPHPVTPKVYAGQCLWEGTNVSEGRGTTRPFELFGAPFFRDLMTDWADRWNEDHPDAVLRPLIFVPVFHKYRSEYCYGFQLHPVSQDFGSLRYSLQLIRSVRAELSAFRWLQGPYESGSERSAIELLTGDPELFDYLNGKVSWPLVLDKLTEHERRWIDECRGYILYGDQLRETR